MTYRRSHNIIYINIYITTRVLKTKGYHYLVEYSLIGRTINVTVCALFKIYLWLWSTNIRTRSPVFVCLDLYDPGNCLLPGGWEHSGCN